MNEHELVSPPLYLLFICLLNWPRLSLLSFPLSKPKPLFTFYENANAPTDSEIDFLFFSFSCDTSLWTLSFYLSTVLLPHSPLLLACPCTSSFALSAVPTAQPAYSYIFFDLSFARSRARGLLVCAFISKRFSCCNNGVPKKSSLILPIVASFVRCDEE